MTNVTEFKGKNPTRKRARLNSGPIESGGGGMGPSAGITADNFADRGKAFIAAAGVGFIIAKRDGKAQGVEYLQTLRQWGAWLAWRKQKGLPMAFMETREFFTVPAEWPHLFDAEATVQGDHEAGWTFEDWQRRHWAHEKDGFNTPAQRLATTTAYRLRMAAKKPPPTPEEHLRAPEREPPWRDRQVLAESGARLAAEMEARS